ncbi:MAG: hypothetical protein EBY28_27125 [Betaproteobacteria bacterium]|nr:hypothetical protein [Betaproteobacteria bacterium]
MQAAAVLGLEILVKLLAERAAEPLVNLVEREVLVLQILVVEVAAQIITVQLVMVDLVLLSYVLQTLTLLHHQLQDHLHILYQVDIKYIHSLPAELLHLAALLIVTDLLVVH